MSDGLYKALMHVSFFLGVSTFVVVFGALVAVPFMLMWNHAVVSAITIAKPIGYWVSFGLTIFFLTFVTGARTSAK
jgi:hypothetical protein